MEIVMASKNEKFGGTRSFLRPRGAVFVDFHLKMGIFDQNQLRAASKMTSYRWIFHSLRPQKFVYLLSTLQLTGLIEKSRQKKIKNFELQRVENWGSTVLCSDRM